MFSFPKFFGSFFGGYLRRNAGVSGTVRTVLRLGGMPRGRAKISFETGLALKLTDFTGVCFVEGFERSFVLRIGDLGRVSLRFLSC